MSPFMKMQRELSKSRVRSEEQTLRLEAPGTQRPPAFPASSELRCERGEGGTVSGDCRFRPQGNCRAMGDDRPPWALTVPLYMGTISIPAVQAL